MEKQFPNVKDKLDAPSKKTAFERAKAEAEAKRQREAAETAAVYEDFVKSFDDEVPSISSRYASDSRGGFGGPRGMSGPPRGGSGPGKRHFTTSGRGASSGPGTLGPPSRKRDLDTFRTDARSDTARSVGGRLGFEDPIDYEIRKTPLKSEKGLAFGVDEDEEDAGQSSREAAKPTVHLRSLPPKTSKLVVQELMKPYFPDLTLAQVTIQYPPVQQYARKTCSALVTLQSDTAASDIDAAVNGLSNKYLGSGFRLSLSRHLPSTAIHSSITSATSQNSAPFNARQLFPTDRGGFQGGRGRGGFAPPTSYASNPIQNQPVNKFVVTVAPPKDIKTLKLIHKTVEAVLGSGPEFEALLMATPSIINDERFFWLWDSRSPEHVYYRWRLWDIITTNGSKNSRAVERSYAGTTITTIFDGGAAWEVPPKKQQKFEFVTQLGDFIEDDEYHSSSDEDEGHQAQDSNPSAEEAKSYLGPLKRAKLMHLLSRMPTTTGTLRRGDVARVTAFAVDNAYAAEEVVDILCANVSRPATFTSANPDYEPNGLDKTKEEISPSKMIALYLISDVLSNSGLGVRNVWRYRQLFDQRLREGKVFEGLAEVSGKEGWGKLRQEKWRRSIENILVLWEGWNLFPQASHEALRAAFSEEVAVVAEPVDAVNAEVIPVVTKPKSKWRTVSAEEEAEQAAKFNPYLVEHSEEVLLDSSRDVGGEAMEEDDDVDGEPMEEEDVDGEPMEDEEMDGELMADDDMDGEPMKDDPAPAPSEVSGMEESGAPEGLALGIGFGFKIGGSKHPGGGGAEGRRKRVRAEDMFATED